MKKVRIKNNVIIDEIDEKTLILLKNQIKKNNSIDSKKILNFFEKNYVELKEIEYKEKYDDEVESLIPKFNLFNGEVEKHYDCIKDVNKINSKINELKGVLQETDYIIIKIYEAKILMLNIPYSQEYIEEICNKRQEARDKINELKKLLQDV